MASNGRTDEGQISRPKHRNMRPGPHMRVTETDTHAEDIEQQMT